MRNYPWKQIIPTFCKRFSHTHVNATHHRDSHIFIKKIILSLQIIGVLQKGFKFYLEIKDAVVLKGQ